VTAISQYPLAVDGIVTRVLEAGTGDNVLVCFHGSGSRADRWRPFMALLAEHGYHVYAVDYPGHGLAQKPAGYPYGSAAFGQFAIDFIDQLGAERVTLLGTSLGGHVAALVSIARPERIAGCVLIGAVGFVPFERDSGGTASPVIDTSLAGTRAKLEFLVADPSIVSDAWVHEESMINSSPGAPEAMKQLAQTSAAETAVDLVADRYKRLGMPTFLVWGAQDRWVPPSVGEDTAAALEEKLHLLEGTSHAPYYEDPSGFLDLVQPFLLAHSQPLSD
jgi:2-hydroxy-6-oxonona-2,4-dienedioate hydrolase